jgi:hypothetical protein
MPHPILALVAAASASTVVATNDLAVHLHKNSARILEPMIIGVEGPDTERVVRKATKGALPAAVEIVRMPIIGDPESEMARILAKTDTRCGLYISPANRGMWTVSTHGDCRSAAQLAAEAQETDGTPADPAIPDPVTVQPAQSPGVFASTDPSTEVDAMWRIAQLEQQLPDPNTAMLQSLVFGFGAGHYYAGNNKRGRLHMGMQAGGLALSALSFLYGAKIADETWKYELASGTMVVGGAVFGADRVWDIYTAPSSAHDVGRRRMEKRR